MLSHTTLWTYFADAGSVVKIVMLIMLAASVLSWTFIIQRSLFFHRIRRIFREFEVRFWSGNDLTRIYTELANKNNEFVGVEHIFMAGFKEYVRLRKQAGVSSHTIIDTVQRAMRIAHARELESLEMHLPFLATVGSISPYIGLFGTVWGIMSSFHALGTVQQASIAMVAPGISEALIATAMGLFAAIPAVIAYNRYTHYVERLLAQYDTFQEEFISILARKSLDHTAIDQNTAGV